MFVSILQVLGGAVLLWFGAGWIVDAAAALARRLRISELVIGLTVVAMGTSMPEFLVTATAAFKGLPDISLANVVGSNIFNLGLILGALALIRPIPTHPTLVWRDGATLLGLCVLILLLSLNHSLGRVEGAVLACVFAGYLGFLLVQARNCPLGKVECAPPQGLESEAQVAERSTWWRDALLLLGGVVALSLGSDQLVEGASTLAEALGISRWVIGLTIVAGGTSLPELVTCLAAALKGKSDLLLGNLIGSDFFNLAGVLGLTCLLRPLSVAPESLPSLYLLVAGVLLVLCCMRTGWRISRGEGALLIVLSLGRWGLELG